MSPVSSYHECRLIISVKKTKYSLNIQLGLIVFPVNGLTVCFGVIYILLYCIFVVYMICADSESSMHVYACEYPTHLCTSQMYDCYISTLHGICGETQCNIMLVRGGGLYLYFVVYMDFQLVIVCAFSVNGALQLDCRRVSMVRRLLALHQLVNNDRDITAHA